MSNPRARGHLFPAKAGMGAACERPGCRATWGDVYNGVASPRCEAIDPLPEEVPTTPELALPTKPTKTYDAKSVKLVFKGVGLNGEDVEINGAETAEGDFVSYEDPGWGYDIASTPPGHYSNRLYDDLPLEEAVAAFKKQLAEDFTERYRDTFAPAYVVDPTFSPFPPGPHQDPGIPSFLYTAQGKELDFHAEMFFGLKRIVERGIFEETDCELRDRCLARLRALTPPPPPPA